MRASRCPPCARVSASTARGVGGTGESTCPSGAPSGGPVVTRASRRQVARAVQPSLCFLGVVAHAHVAFRVSWACPCWCW